MTIYAHMLFRRRFTLAGPVAIALAMAGLVAMTSAVEPAGTSETSKTPSPHFIAGALAHENFIGITNDDRLVSVNVNWGTKRDYHKIEGALPSIEVLDDRACLVSSKEVICVTLSNGQQQRVKHALGGRAAAGFVDSSHVFVQDGNRLQVIELQTGEVTRDIKLFENASEKAQVRGFSGLGGLQCAHARHLDRLFIARPGRGIAVVDLRRGVLTRSLDTTYTVAGLAILKDKLVVRNFGVSYGIIFQSHEFISLANFDERKRAGLERLKDKDQLRIAYDDVVVGRTVVANHMLYAAVDKSVLKINADGELVGISEDVVMPNALLVSNGTKVLVSDEMSLRSIHFVAPKGAVNRDATGNASDATGE